MNGFSNSLTELERENVQKERTSQGCTGTHSETDLLLSAETEAIYYCL